MFSPAMPARRAEEKRTGEAERFARSVLGDRTALFLRVDPLVDAGLQVPRAQRKVNPCNENPIIPVQRRLEKIEDFLGRSLRLHEPCGSQNSGMSREFAD